MEGYFRIITPVYNSEKWIGDCIRSVLSQTDEKWTQIVVVDGSTDNTYEEALLAANGDPRINIISVENRAGICNSHVIAHDYSVRNSEDVFVHLDGDDSFLNNQTLEYIRKVYSQNNVWATYGNYTTHSGKSSVCRSVDITEGVREQILKGWPFSHLRTFKTFLWDKVNKQDLKDKDNNNLTAAVDVAIFTPILEMCGNRIAYIKKPLYKYNDGNPLNEDKCRLQDQVRCALEIYGKKRYRTYE